MTVITGEADVGGIFVTVQAFTRAVGSRVAVTAIAGPVGNVRVGTTTFQITS